MTASTEPNEPQAQAPDESRALPRARDLVFSSFALTKRYAGEVYGFAAYLLFPLIFAFGVQKIPGTTGEILQSLVNVLFLLLGCWIEATIIVLISMRLTYPQKDPDPRSVSMYALSILSTLTLTLLLAGFLEFAGAMLFVLPGLILGVMLTFSAQEVVLRGCGPLSALAASRNLVKGRILPIALRLGALITVTMGLYFAVAFGIFFGFSAISGASISSLSANPPAWLDALLSVLQIILLPPFVIGHTLLYLSLESQPSSSS